MVLKKQNIRKEEVEEIGDENNMKLKWYFYVEEKI